MSSQDAQTFNWHYDRELDDENLELRGRKLFFLIVLFAIILFTTVLFLYVRWICHYRRLFPTTELGSIQSRHAPPQPPPPPPPSQGLDAETIKKLPMVLHQAPSDPNCALEETECCICLSAFRDGEKLKVLPGCDHCFHCECVDKWLTNHSSCPLCRASLKLDSSFPRILIQEPPVRINFQV